MYVSALHVHVFDSRGWKGVDLAINFKLLPERTNDEFAFLTVSKLDQTDLESAKLHERLETIQRTPALLP